MILSLKALSFFKIFLLGIFLTAIFTWPFITKLGNFYSDTGDYPLVGYILWNNQNALISGKIFNQQEYFKSNQLYPLPTVVSYSEHLFIPSLIFSPIYWVTNNLVFSVNIFSFLTFVLNFISSYYTIKVILKNELASLVGAVIFSFNPLTLAHFPEHVALQNKYFLPPLFLSFFHFLKKPDLKTTGFFAIFFVLNSLSASYFEVFSLVIILLMTIMAFVIKIKNKQAKYFFAIVKNSWIFLLFTPLLLFFNLPYYNFSNNEIISRGLGENIYYSATIMDWFMPNHQSLIYSGISNFIADKLNFINPNRYQEHTLFLNLVPTLLFLISFGYFRSRVNSKTEKDLLFFSVFILIVSFTLSLGPLLKFWDGNLSTIILPYYFLYELFLPLRGLRVPARLEFIFYVPFSMMAAYGTLHLLKKRARSLVIIITILALLIVENYEVRNYQDSSDILKNVNNTNINYKLAFLKNRKTIHLPVFKHNFGEDSRYLNWITQTEETTMNGYSGYPPRDHLLFLQEINNNLNEDSLKKLYSLDVDYIIIHKNLLTYSELVNYNFYKETYKDNVFLDQNDIMILDIKKFNFKLNTCDFFKDIEIQSSEMKQLTLKNKSNCYLPSIYQNRYKDFTFIMRGLKYKVHLKLPEIIGPFEEITFKKANNDFKYQLSD